MKYIDVEKLIAEIEKLKKEARKNALIARDNNNMSVCTLWSGKEHICTEILNIIISLQQEQSNQEESIYVHKKYNRKYRIVSNNARLKNSDGEWIDCVIYAPLYENEFEMFAREKDSFYKEFEKK